MRRGMMGVLVGLLLCSGMTGASANPIAEAGNTVVDTTVTGARWTGHTIGAGVTWVLVNTDQGLHWVWTVGHNQLIHPLVSALTLGGVELPTS